MAPGFAMTRCRHVPTTKAPVGNFNRCLRLLFGPGWAYKYPNPSPLEAAVNSLFMAAE